ncbi:sodium-dependent transporter [Gallaecimonas xiamenensis]|uniref:Transporter n=1 Tax=Gallaecimonas xiamenensis 3-C-1 TaxID=745411 RepID=K2JAR6_9GAMM|nr:sodium-dependent transporter [Gallaecimonas xiamenensis]EKE72188.1 sodium:neurotransmitter symporter [Gallaecimonas xiamenensis 3-C-1]
MQQANAKKGSTRWSNRFAYILAATGAAVGLGNIWKFPYIMGENGGGAFVLVYLLCIVFIGVPVMMAEVAIGKQGRHTPGHSVSDVAKASGKPAWWGFVGWMGVISGYLILSFYVVIAGWALAYIFKAGAGQFGSGDPKAVANLFAGLTGNGWALLGWTSTVILATVLVIGKGVKAGLERAVSALMPLLFVILLILAGYAASEGDFGAAFHFMFDPDFSKLSINGVVVALGHSFFTLSLASGIMIMYGAYLPEGVSIAKSSLWIAFFDTLVALIAGLAIYPIVFANGLEPGAGPGLIFQTLPIAFGQMPGGRIVGTLFFIMLVFAAFTSALALIESSVAWLVEKRGFSRWGAAFAAGFGIWLLSLGTIASVAELPISQFAMPWGKSDFFTMLDYFTANIALPIGGLLIALFTGWVANKGLMAELIDAKAVFRLWHPVIKFLAPLAILLVFLQLTGIIQL